MFLFVSVTNFIQMLIQRAFIEKLLKTYLFWKKSCFFVVINKSMLHASNIPNQF